MSPELNFLLTMTDGVALYRVALQIDNGNLMPGDARQYPLEPENLAYFHSLLPGHVQTLGTIVHVEEIFEIVKQKA
jgi:hypothetical protein